uniref:SUEL-type lectin domain-containing protein n=1 Tax=Steinernema glaseri TaxID=37863 RepID=A0A1I7Y5H7_9BILA
MRSTVGLLAALLSLLGSSLATASYEKVIACGLYSETVSEWPYPLAMAKWPPDTSNFSPIQNFHLFYDCNFDSINWGCRNAYKGVFYGVDMKENKTLLTCVRNCGPRFIVDPYEPYNVSVEMKLFKCQDYIPAEEPEVPEGSWSDMLRAQKSCKSEAEWLNASTKECGEKPKNYVLGAQCGDQEKYLEVIFVCDQPERSIVSKEERDRLDANTAHLHELQFSLFRHFYTLTKHFQESKSSSSAQALKNYTKELSMAYAVASQATFNHSKQFTMNRIAFYRFPDENGYSSRQFSSAYLKDYIVGRGTSRSLSLLLVAIDLLTNVSHPMTVLAHWDVELADTSATTLHDTLFPELGEPLTNFYVEYMKNHTFGIAREHLGFLRESDAYTRLISMYEEIFRPGFIDDKYMDKTPREGDFASLLASYQKVHRPLPPWLEFRDSSGLLSLRPRSIIKSIPKENNKPEAYQKSFYFCQSQT